MEDAKHIWAVFVGTFTSLWSFLHDMIVQASSSGLSPSVGACVAISILLAVYFGSGFMAMTIAEMRESNRWLHFAMGLLVPYLYPLALIVLLPKVKPESVRKREAAEAKAEEALESAVDAHAKGRPIPVRPHAQQPKDDLSPETMRMTKLNETVSRTVKDLSPSQRTVTNVMPKVSPNESDPIQTMRDEMPIDQEQAEKFSAPISVAVENASDTAVSSRPIMNQQFFASISVDPSGNHMGPFMFEMSDGRFLEAIRIVNPMSDLLLLEIPGEAGRPKTIRIPYSKILDCKLKSDWLEQR